MRAAANLDRTIFSSDLTALNLHPLWERTIRLAPGTAAVPAIWRWREVRPQLARAAELLSTREADRRVLSLGNPALRGANFVAATLSTGLQIVLPGEVAPVHRHSPNALRFVVEGEGAYTVVDGERVDMRPGDLVVTHGWTWHEHGNAGNEPVVWLDGLDLPLTSFLGAFFFENSPEGIPPVGARKASTLLRYPYERAWEALAQLARNSAPHPSHGFKLRYVDRENGHDLFPTMAAFMQLLPSGFAGTSCRSTDSAVYCVAEGRGRVEIGDSSYLFGPHDVFVVPSWEPHCLDAADECLLFSYSDRAAQEALGLWREEL